MTTFNQKQTFVWVWLPSANEPIVAGKLSVEDHDFDFNYGQSYLSNDAAIAFSLDELPLMQGQRFRSSSELHRTLSDSLPDAWGRRVLAHRYARPDMSVIDLLLLSGSDRIGALHFQEQPDHYNPRYEEQASINEVFDAAELLEQGKPIPHELDLALFHGTSIGGARPKAMLEHNEKKYIAKFSSSTDLFPIVQAEYAAMTLATKLGLQVAPTSLEYVRNRPVLFVERFDRQHTTDGWHRKFINSALTLLGLGEHEGRYASYLELADVIRKVSRQPGKDLLELYRRMVFNILIGNTDDHAKNHAFIWDGDYYQLAPAYDICPYYRAGQQATQAMVVGKYGSYSLVKNAISAASAFLLDEQQATEEATMIKAFIIDHWPEVCELARLTSEQQKMLTGTAVLNPYCFYDEP